MTCKSRQSGWDLGPAIRVERDDTFLIICSATVPDCEAWRGVRFRNHFRNFKAYQMCLTR